MTVLRPTANFLLVFCVLLASFRLSQSQTPSAEPSHTSFAIARGTRTVLSSSLLPISFSFVEAQESLWELPNGFGQFEITEYPDIPYKHFTLQQLINGSVSYQHNYTAGLTSVHINVTITTNTEMRVYYISANPFEGNISLATNSCLPLVENTNKLLSSDNLLATTNFSNQNPVLSYTILSPLAHGYLEVYEPMTNPADWHWVKSNLRSRRPANTFIQSEINSEHVRYVSTAAVPDGMGMLLDSFQFSVFSNQLPGPEGSFCIRVLSLVKPSLVVAAANVSVAEGGEVTVTRSGFSVSLSSPLLEDLQRWWDEPFDINQLGIEVIITRQPQHGKLILFGNSLSGEVTVPLTLFQNNSVLYTHDGSETFLDSIGFRLRATSVSSLPLILPDQTEVTTLWINIQPVNDNSPILTQSGPITLTEGSYIILNSSMLHVEDPDQNTSPADISIELLPNQTDPNSRFATVNSIDQAIERFRYSDILHKRIIFYSAISTEGQLELTRGVRVTDGLHSHETIVNISIAPIVISATANLQDCHATLDTLSSSLSVSLPVNAFNLSISSRQLIHQVLVYIATPPEHGEITDHSSNSSSPPLDKFMYVDMEEHRIHYTLSDRHTRMNVDTFDVMFKLGHGTSNPVPFRVCILPLPHPYLVNNRLINIKEGTEIVLTNETLRANQTRPTHGSPADIRFYITQSPFHGTLVNNTRDERPLVTSFTQADIDEEMISFVSPTIKNHINSDNFSFTLANEYYNVTQSVYSIEVAYEITDIKTIHEFTVKEGEHHIITTDEFFVAVPPGYTGFTIYIPVQPRHGNLILTYPNYTAKIDPHTVNMEEVRNGYFSYSLDLSEETDYVFFHFVVVARRPDHPAETLSYTCDINVILVNDNAPEEILNVESQVFNQGQVAITLADNLKMSDADIGYDSNNLKYVLQDPYRHGPTQGYLYFANDSATKIDTWYQGDMNGALHYRHDGRIPQSSFDFMRINVTDGLHVVSILFHILVQDIQFIRTGISSVPVNEGGSVIVGKKYLEYSVNIVDTVPADYKYTVVIPPSHGKLEKRSLIPLIPFELPLVLPPPQEVSSFTQKDLNDFSIVYVHDGSETTMDRFTFSLTVRGHKKNDDYVSFRINPVDDQPPRLIANEPLFVLSDYRYESLNVSVLQMADNDTTRKDQLEYIVTSPPKYGKLHRRRGPSSDLPLLSDVDQWNQTNRFSQQDIENTLIWYRHTNLSTWIDSFAFKIFDGTNEVSETFIKKIIVLPNKLTVSINRARVAEGGQTVLPHNSFYALHPYFADRQFTVHIQSSPNGDVRYVSNNSIATTFTSTDLANSQIKYIHNGDEDPVAEFTFYLDFGLRRSASIRYYLDVESINDNPPVLHTTKTLVLWAKQVVTINQTYLLTTDRDLPPSELRYIFNFEPGQASDGHFALQSSQDVPNSNFTQEQVNSSSIVFVDLHTYDGVRNISFTVSDGLYTVQGFFVVDAQVLKLHRPYPGVRMVVGIGMAAYLTDEALHFQTNAVSPSTSPSQIVFNLKPGSPKYGSLYRTGDRSKSISSFTQEDIDHDQVVYVHEAVDVWEGQDQLNLVVSTPLAESVHDTENITILLPPIQADPLATVGALFVMENNASCLNLSILDARNFRYMIWNQSKTTQLPLASVRLAYRVYALPNLGNILARNEEVQSFNQSDMEEGVVCYKHRSGTESEKDEFTLEVMVVSNNSESEITVLNSTMATITVNIKLYNDEKPLLLTSSAPQKNIIVSFPSPITKADLEVQDKDNSPSEISFTVLSLDGDNGLRLQGDPITEITEFTQSDIDNGRLYFNASNSITLQFNFSFTDGMYNSDVYTFSLSAVDHDWTVEENDIFIPQTNPSVILSMDTIKVTTNGFVEETMYTIIRAPSHGRVDVTGVATGNFTQSDLISDLVVYELTDYSVYNDSFTIQVTNRQLSRIVKIHVTIEADDSGTKQDKLLEADMCQVLPPDIIDLSSLSLRRNGVILLKLVEDLKFGELRVFYDQPHRTKRNTYYDYKPGRSKRGTGKREFRYDDYKSGFVYYMWKLMPNVTANSTYMETLSVTVVVNGLPPGFLSVNFTVVAPPGATMLPTTSVTVSSTPSSEPTTAPPTTGTDNSSAYSIVNLLVPTVGIVVLILIVTVVIFVFCLAHSGKIMTSLKSKKAGSILSFPTHRGLSPYRAPSHSTLRSPHLRGRVEDDVTRDDETNSDISSAASIVVLPTFQSHHQVPPAFLRQGSQGYVSGSTYSHTLSYGDSPLYDEDDENSARTTPFPLQRILESPVPRAALHSPTRLDNSSYAFARGSHARATSPARGRGFSAGRATGRLSPSKSTSMREVSYNPQFRLVRTSSRESSTTMDYESESSFPRGTPRLQHITSPGLAVTTESSSTSAPAANDNEKLYRTTNPVLKDTEYWV